MCQLDVKSFVINLLNIVRTRPFNKYISCNETGKRLPGHILTKQNIDNKHKPKLKFINRYNVC